MYQELLEAKKAGKEIYCARFLDGEVFFSPLKWKDYKIYRELSHMAPDSICDIEEDIWKSSLIHTTYTDDYIEKHAGIITVISRLIMRLSGAKDLQDYMEAQMVGRSMANAVDDAIIAKIAFIFHLKPDEVKDMTWSEINIRLAQAEILSNAPFEYKMPEEEKPLNIVEEIISYRKFEDSAPAGDWNLHRIRDRNG